MAVLLGCTWRGWLSFACSVGDQCFGSHVLPCLSNASVNESGNGGVVASVIYCAVRLINVPLTALAGAAGGEHNV